MDEVPVRRGLALTLCEDGRRGPIRLVDTFQCRTRRPGIGEIFRHARNALIRVLTIMETKRHPSRCGYLAEMSGRF